MEQIEKIDDTHDPNFNAIDMRRKIRTLSIKMNEIIETLNAITKEYDEEHSDEDDFIEVPNKLKLK